MQRNAGELDLLYLMIHVADLLYLSHMLSQIKKLKFCKDYEESTGINNMFEGQLQFCLMASERINWYLLFAELGKPVYGP